MLGATSIHSTSLLQILERMDSVLDKSGTICLIGASAIILLGAPTRQTNDIDLWMPETDLPDSILAKAARSIGLDWNNRTDIIERPHVQPIRPGIVQLPTTNSGLWPTGQKSHEIWRGERLIVVAPPPAILGAAKMVVARDHDLEDIAFLVSRRLTNLAAIRQAATHFPAPASKDALENMSLLEAFLVAGTPRPTDNLGTEDTR